MVSPLPDALSRLCRALGVATSWHDIEGREQTPPADALRAIVRSLGAETHGAGDDADALARLEDERARRFVEPVHVGTPGRAFDLPLSVPGNAGVDVRVDTEDGAEVRAAVSEPDRKDGARRARVPALPPGRHRARVACAGREMDCTLLVAPRRAYEGDLARAAGVFAPVFTLGDPGAASPGTFADLESFAERVGELGIGVVATLPLLPTFDDDPSPYAPLSRSFWNERLVDAATLPGAEDGSRTAQELADRFFASGAARGGPFGDWLSGTPGARAFARFRAACARHPAGRPSPAELTAALATGDTLDDPLARRALFLQWAAESALARIAARASDGYGALALDLPVSVHPDGFDRLAEPALFADGISVGCPPDPLCEEGQNWGLPPVAPGASRADGHAAFARAIRHHVRHAGLLRIDHVMSLHRLFFVPSGFDSAHGSYVTYPADELWSVVTLEAARARCVIVGEDLGVVPDVVREELAERGALRTWVWLFEAGADDDTPEPPAPPESCCALLTTHDTPTFAGFLRAHDVALRERLGQIDADDASRRREERRALRERLEERFGVRGREPADDALLDAVLAWLAASPARVVTVALDDLLLVEEPINVPGTTTERANWRRCHARPLGEVLEDPQIRARLATLARRGRSA